MKPAFIIAKYKDSWDTDTAFIVVDADRPSAREGSFLVRKNGKLFERQNEWSMEKYAGTNHGCSGKVTDCLGALAILNKDAVNSVVAFLLEKFGPLPPMVIGSYQVTFNEDGSGIKVGCQPVTKEQITEIAKRLKIIS